MNISKTEIKNLENNGFLLKKNVLAENEVKIIKQIILKNNEGKDIKESIFPVNLKGLVIKLLKFQFAAFKNSLFLLKIKKNLFLDENAKNLFNEPMCLKMIDGYHNKKTSEDILPWHSDQAYSGALKVEDIKSPDYFFLKFFFYLTSVSPNNGCTSYIPGSQKITYAVRSCIFEKKIKYQPFWSLKDLINTIENKNNYFHILEKLGSRNLLDDFLKKGKKCDSNKFCKDYDFYANPGDLLIFNETGVHRGSNPSLSDRVVLRYLYAKKN